MLVQKRLATLTRIGSADGFFRKFVAFEEQAGYLLLSYLVLLQTADEVLDYRAAADYYRDHQLCIEAGGNHRFENLADHLAAIDQFRHGRAA